MAKGLLKIGQISDIHIGEDASLVQGIDVRANFLKALYSSSMNDTDLIVLSGDLANEDGERGAYSFIASELKKINKPFCIIPGNHDRLEVMRDYFDLPIKNNQCYYRYDIQEHSLFFLDSSSGVVSKEQLAYLKEEAAKIEGEIILFLHHPVCFCKHQFMDVQHHLQNMFEVRQVLNSIENLNHVFCGHYHVCSEHFDDGLYIHVAPSTQMEIDPNVPYFKLTSTEPAWQIIEWNSNIKVKICY